jgi:hypothetical protein
MWGVGRGHGSPLTARSSSAPGAFQAVSTLQISADPVEVPDSAGYEERAAAPYARRTSRP